MKHIVTSNLEVVTMHTLSQFIKGLIDKWHDSNFDDETDVHLSDYLTAQLMANGYCSVIEIVRNEQKTIPNV